MGPCAKVIVLCTIQGNDGVTYAGTNWCENPQKVCPRLPGEDYTKCKTICNQQAHAEVNALAEAGAAADGGTALLHGHTWFCRQCQEALFTAGVKTIGLSTSNL